MSQAHQQHEQLQRRRRRRWEQQQQQQRCRQSAEFCECLRPVIRVFGLLTSFGKHTQLTHTNTHTHTPGKTHK